MTNSPNKKSRSGLYVILILIATLLLLCGSPFAWWFGRKSVANRKLEQRIAALRERGMPVDNASLAVFREQRMSKEKTDRWTKLLMRFDTIAFTTSDAGVPIIGDVEVDQSFVPGEDWAHAEDVAAFLDTCSELRREIHELTEGTDPIWTPIDFQSYDTRLPYVQYTRTAARLMTLEHIDAVRRDDRQQVFESLLALIGISRSLEREPVPVSQLVHVACLSTALQQLKLSLELDLLTDQQMLRILAQIQQITPMGDRFRLAFAGERALALAMFDDSDKLSGGRLTAALGPDRPIDALMTLDTHAQLESADTNSLDAFLADLNRIEQEFAEKVENASRLRQFYTVFTTMTFPTMTGVGGPLVSLEMKQRIAKAAIGVRLYQYRFDRWPQSLDDLSELDVELGSLQPLGEKPFGFRVVDDQAVLWGFEPQSGATHTPDDPADLDSLDESERSQQGFWIWRLAPPRAASAEQPSPKAPEAMQP